MTIERRGNGIPIQTKVQPSRFEHHGNHDFNQLLARGADFDRQHSRVASEAQSGPSFGH